MLDRTPDQSANVRMMTDNVPDHVKQRKPPSAFWMWIVVSIFLLFIAFIVKFVISPDKVKEWQTSLGALLGFSGLMTMEAVRLMIQNKRENWNRWLECQALGHSLITEIAFLISRLNESKNNLGSHVKDFGRESSRKLKISSYRLIQLPESNVYNKFIEKSSLFPQPDSNAIMEFYVWYAEAQRIIEVYLDPETDHEADQEDIKMIIYTLSKTLALGNAALYTLTLLLENSVKDDFSPGTNVKS
jgi:hypothetical protein